VFVSRMRQKLLNCFFLTKCGVYVYVVYEPQKNPTDYGSKLDRVGIRVRVTVDIPPCRTVLRVGAGYWPRPMGAGQFIPRNSGHVSLAICLIVIKGDC